MKRSTNRGRAAAEAIAQEMHDNRIPLHRVTYRTDGLTNLVQVTLLDASPALRRKAAVICEKYQVILEDPVSPGNIIDNRRDDVPQVTAVELRNNLSDRLCARIAYYINQYTPNRADINRVWDMFEGKVPDYWLHHQRAYGMATA